MRLSTVIERLDHWLKEGDIGVSSLCLANCVLEGLADEPGVPYDQFDFARCYQLLRRVPELQCSIGDLAARYPEWVPFAEHWPSLTALYERGERTQDFRGFTQTLHRALAQAHAWRPAEEASDKERVPGNR